MKRISGLLFNALKTRATHVVYGFEVTRQDGVQVGFTSGDQPFTLNGLNYEPTNGFSGTAAASKQNLSVDNINATALITNSIPESDLKAGFYDNAIVRVFWIAPDHPEWGVVPIRGGRFGEVTLKNNQFEVELRAVTYFLQQPYGKFFTLECSAKLGDDQCKVNLNADTWRPNTVYLARALADAGIGSWVKPTTPNGFWYWCQQAGGGVSSTSGLAAWSEIGNGSQITDDEISGASGAAGSSGLAARFFNLTKTGQGAGAAPYFSTNAVQGDVDITGSYVNSGAYLTPTKQYEAPKSAPLGTQPITITTRHTTIVLRMGTSGGGEPAWPIGSGAQVGDNNLVWRAYPARRWDATVSAVFSRGEFEAAGMPFEPHFFQYGSITWLTGRNAGLTMEVRDFLKVPQTAFYLLEQMPFRIQVGDTFEAVVGCSHTRSTCLNKFENINNMRAFPDMPTEDRALQTPNFTQQGTQEDPNSGGS